MNEFKSYKFELPYLRNESMNGKLIVIEGADCSGRSTQVELLKNWLEYKGHAVVNTGLKRSTLFSEIINNAKSNVTLGKNTMSLLYATDFADELEQKIVPALKAGFIVLADRYIYTLMVRDILRGANKDWLRKVFGFALIPDLIIYLETSTKNLMHRTFLKYGRLRYWESGMDIHLSHDMLKSFKKYHDIMKNEYVDLSNEYGFITIDGNKEVKSIQKEIQKTIENELEELVNGK
jgi:dTMP kinase